MLLRIPTARQHERTAQGALVASAAAHVRQRQTRHLGDHPKMAKPVISYGLVVQTIRAAEQEAPRRNCSNLGATPSHPDASSDQPAFRLGTLYSPASLCFRSSNAAWGITSSEKPHSRQTSTLSLKSTGAVFFRVLRRLSKHNVSSAGKSLWYSDAHALQVTLTSLFSDV
jgi:hypothetical protein